jgi:hypothetical protein
MPVERSQIVRSSGYAVMPHKVFDQMVVAGVGADAIAVYTALNRYASGDCREAWPAIKRIQSDLKRSRHVVIRAIRALEACGLISVERRRAPHGGLMTNIYTLLDLPGTERETEPPRPERGEGAAENGQERPADPAPQLSPPSARDALPLVHEMHYPSAPRAQEQDTDTKIQNLRAERAGDTKHVAGRFRKEKAARSRPDDPLYEIVMRCSFGVEREDAAQRRIFNGRVVRIMGDLCSVAFDGKPSPEQRAALAAELERMYAWHAEQGRDVRLEVPASGASIWRTLKRFRDAAPGAGESEIDEVAADERERQARTADPMCEKCGGSGYYREALMPDGTREIYGLVRPEGCVSTGVVECQCSRVR